MLLSVLGPMANQLSSLWLTYRLQTSHRAMDMTIIMLESGLFLLTEEGFLKILICHRALFKNSGHKELGGKMTGIPDHADI